MSANQVKLAHQFILIINTFLRLVDEREKKAYAGHHIGKDVSEAVRRCLTGRN